MKNTVRRWPIVLLVVTLVLIGLLVHFYAEDPFVYYYALVFTLLTFARVFDWPQHTWLASRNLDKVRESAGSNALSAQERRSVKVVRDLRGLRGTTPYFAAMVHQKNSETLCREFSKDLPPKIAGYACALALYGFLAHRPGAAS